MAVAVLAVAGIAIAARGGDDKKATKGTDLTAIKCPLEPTGKTVGGTPEYRPAKDAFDTAELIGSEARGRPQEGQAEDRCDIVVSVKDGAGQPVPIELDPKLIYVYTEKDVVTQIEGVGGGI